MDALNWFIFTLGELAENVRVSTNPEIPEYFDKRFKRNSIFLSRLVYGLSANLTEYTSEFFHHQCHQEGDLKAEPVKVEETPDILDLSAQPTAEDEYITLAKHLSAILTNEKTSLYATAIVLEIEKYHPEIKRLTVKNLSEILRDENIEESEISQETAQVLNLSTQTTEEDECIDLAKHLSAVLKDPRTPANLFNAIRDELSNLGEGVLTEVVDSAEFIAKQLHVEANQNQEAAK